MFTGVALDDSMEFKLKDGEEDDDKNEGGDDEVGGGMGFPFLASAKTTGE